MPTQYNQTTVGTSAVALGTGACDYGVDIKALPGNSGTVYVGVGLPPSADDVTALNGWPLAAGNETSIGAGFLPDRDVGDIWIIGTAGGQKVAWRSR